MSCALDPYVLAGYWVAGYDVYQYPNPTGGISVTEPTRHTLSVAEPARKSMAAAEPSRKPLPCG